MAINITIPASENIMAEPEISEAVKEAVSLIMKDMSRLEKNWEKDSLTLRHDMSVAIGTARARLMLWLGKVDAMIFEPPPPVAQMPPAALTAVIKKSDRWAEEVRDSVVKKADTTLGANAIEHIAERIIMRLKTAIQMTFKKMTRKQAEKAALVVSLTLNALKTQLGVEEAIVPAPAENAVL